MAYIVLSDLQKFFPEANLIDLFADAELGQDAPTAVNADILNAIIEGVSEDVDGYLRRRFSLPLVTVPASLKKRVASLVVYEGFKRRAAAAGGVVPMETRKAFYDDQIDWLRRLADGDVDIGIVAPMEANASRAVEYSSADRVFTDDTMRGSF
jgi:phage gp36-like protein